MLLGEIFPDLKTARYCRRPSWPEGVALGVKAWTTVVLSPNENGAGPPAGYQLGKEFTFFESERYIALFGSSDGAERWADGAPEADLQAEDWELCERPPKSKPTWTAA